MLMLIYGYRQVIIVKKQIFRSVFIMVLSAAFCAFFTLNISALSNIFRVQDVKFDKLTETVEGGVLNFDDLNITTNATFHKINDAVKYTITLKNTDSSEHVIKSITDNGENDYISYEYDSYEGTVINAGESFDFVVIAKYTNALTNLDERVQTANIKFVIDYVGGEDEVMLVPDTGANTMATIGNAIKNNVAIFIILTIGLVVYMVVVAKNHKKYSKVVIGLAAAILTFVAATSIKALNIDVNSIKFNTSYNVLDKLAVTYVVDDTEEVVAVDYGTKITPKEIPDKLGHRTDGWVLEDGSDFDSDTVLTEDIKLIAKYTATYVTVNFHGNGLKFSGDVETNQVRIDDACIDKPLPAAISHTDKVDDNGVAETDQWDNIVGYSDDLATKDVVTVPGATSLLVTIKYDIEEGWDALYIFEGEYTGDVLEIGDMQDAGQIETLTGYDYDTGGIATKTLTIVGDTITFAFYSDTSYGMYGYYATIDALDADGNVLPSGNTTTVCGQNVISGNYKEPTLAIKQIFYGWSLDPEYLGVNFVTLDDILRNLQAEPGDTVDLYAAWWTKHTITYNGNGATDGDNYSYDEYSETGIRLDYNNTFSRDGYELIGWSTNPNATTPEYHEGDSFEVPSGNGETVFYAVWAKYHTITFNGNGATSGSMSSQDILQGMTDALNGNNFSRTNYVFAGWSTDQNATMPTYGDGADFTAPTDSDSTVLYAVWRVNPVVTFDGNGATSGSMSTQQFTYNTPAQLNNNGFSRTNYDFLGWSLDKDATTPTYANRATFTPPTDRDQVTLYAIWIKKFEIHYDSNGGEGTMSTSRFSRGDSVRFTKNAFTRYKYAFIGWSTDPNATEAMYVDRANYTVPSEGEGITLYAVWEPAYVVTYGDGDATSGTMSGAYTMMHRVGDEGDLVSPNLEKDGYGFVGWSPDPDAASKIDNTSNQPTIYGPNERITLTNALATTADDELEIPLYAVWIPADENYTFQTFDKTAFEAANPNKKVVALRDERDGNVYAIAKQEDGQWWMIENLRLDFSDSNTNFTAANSNNPAASFVSAVAAYKGRTSTFNNCNSQSAACYNTISFYTGNLNSANATNYDQPVYADRQTPLAWYSYGVLYNQYTANASYLGYDGTLNTNNAGDICARGWRLPTGLATGDFSNLDIALGGQGARFNSGTPTQNDHGAAAWTKYPVNGVKAGIFSDQGISWRNQAGIYLSATKGSYNSSNASAFFAGYISQYGNNDYVDSTKPGNYWETSINAGFAVRCIAK